MASAVQFGLRICARFIEKTTVKSFINFSDTETAILALKDVAARALPIVEACPVGDHQSNGSIDVSVGELKRERRAIRMQLEKGLILCWRMMILFLLEFRHAQATRLRVINEV